MLSVLIAMVVVLTVAALVVTYVAYPHRGEDVPGAPWLGQLMRRATGAAPMVQPREPGGGAEARARADLEQPAGAGERR